MGALLIPQESPFESWRLVGLKAYWISGLFIVTSPSAGMLPSPRIPEAVISGLKKIQSFVKEPLTRVNVCLSPLSSRTFKK
jgi:hypothetical protein